VPSGVPHLIIEVLEVYGAIGAIVAALFLLFALDRVDPLAHGAYAFRPLLIPGLVMLWPLVGVCWMRRTRR
jgi:hypothetical protein